MKHNPLKIENEKLNKTYESKILNDYNHFCENLEIDYYLTIQKKFKDIDDI